MVRSSKILSSVQSAAAAQKMVENQGTDAEERCQAARTRHTMEETLI